MARLATAVFLLAMSGQVFGDVIPQFAGQSNHPSGASAGPVCLPRTIEQIDSAIAAIEMELADVHRRISIATATEHESKIRLALPDDLQERKSLLQQWAIALDEHARHLRRLKDIRRVNEEHGLGIETVSGPTAPMTFAATEQLIDGLAARRLELRRAQMLLSILEREVARNTARLDQSGKRLRLANDQLNQSGSDEAHRNRSLETAPLHQQVDEALLEAAETGRLVTWEEIEGLRKCIGILETKRADASAPARITNRDVEGVLSQIQAKRSTLQKELNDAISADKALRTSMHATTQRDATELAIASDLPALTEVARARADASSQKVESLRLFLRLADYAQTVWEDRLWAAQEHPLERIRDKQRHYELALDGLGEWRVLMEQSLSALSEQVLRQALKADDSRLTMTEHESAAQIYLALQERALAGVRVVGALAFAENLTTRLHDELVEQVARASWLGRLRRIATYLGGVGARIWNSELYIAEEGIIAGGKKVSVPRSITLGKVTIGIAILAIGLVAARCIYGLTKRLALRWFRAEAAAAASSAKVGAALVCVASFLIAMALVHIPWTIFAFLGGAFAIGLGFGAQALIKNFISGVILLCERTIRVGDIVEVDSQRGKIAHVGFRNSLLTRGDGIEVLIPNSQFLEKKVVNWTLSDDLIRYAISVKVANGASLTAVTRLMSQAAAEHPHVMREPPSEVLLDDFDEDGLLFVLHFWMHLRSGVDGVTVRSELRHRISALLQEAGVPLAVPHREVHLALSLPGISVPAVRLTG